MFGNQLPVQVTILKKNNLKLYDIKYSYFILIILNKSIEPIDGILLSTTTPNQTESGNNGKGGILHCSQIFTIR